MITTIDEIIDKAVSYVERSKEDFVNYLLRYPELKNELEKMLNLEDNQEWLKRGEKEGYFFIIDDDHFKLDSNCAPPNRVIVTYVGEGRGVPTIKLIIHRKPVR